MDLSGVPFFRDWLLRVVFVGFWCFEFGCAFGLFSCCAALAVYLLRVQLVRCVFGLFGLVFVVLLSLVCGLLFVFVDVSAVAYFVWLMVVGLVVVCWFGFSWWVWGFGCCWLLFCCLSCVAWTLGWVFCYCFRYMFGDVGDCVVVFNDGCGWLLV